MQNSNCENMNFVCLLEEHTIILKKCQHAFLKIQKQDAVAEAIRKWEAMNGKKLTEEAFTKKVSNLKVRCNVAVNKGQPLLDWQQKLLDITKVRRIYY